MGVVVMRGGSVGVGEGVVPATKPLDKSVNCSVVSSYP